MTKKQRHIIYFHDGFLQQARELAGKLRVNGDHCYLRSIEAYTDPSDYEYAHSFYITKRNAVLESTLEAKRKQLEMLNHKDYPPFEVNFIGLDEESSEELDVLRKDIEKTTDEKDKKELEEKLRQEEAKKEEEALKKAEAEATEKAKNTAPSKQKR